jgi:hypothetical protein
MEDPYYLRVSLNFYPYFTHLLPDMGEIRHKNLHTLPVSSCEFGEYRPKIAVLFLRPSVELCLCVHRESLRNSEGQESRDK